MSSRHQPLNGADSKAGLAETKSCVTCGKVIYRKGVSATNWAKKRMCSRVCADRGKDRPALSDFYDSTAPGCWEWQGYVGANGYGHIRDTAAHRLVWMELVGPIPEGYQIDHLCLNRRCVKPAHLEPVTPAENVRRSYWSRLTCKYGHPMDGRKTNGIHRYCKTCERERQRRKVAAA